MMNDMEIVLAICFVSIVIVMAVAFLWMAKTMVEMLIERSKIMKESLAMLEYYIDNQ